jgi:antitoxin CptB
MNRIDSTSDGTCRTDPDTRRRRILFRSWRRGTQEADLLLGSFAEDFLAVYDGAQLDRLEALLDCTDPDLFDWIICGISPPPEHDHDVMRMLRAFSDRPKRPLENAAACAVHR